MATKDFKIRHSLTVSENATIEGNLTLGGNTVSRLIDSDEVVSIINQNVSQAASDSDSIVGVFQDPDNGLPSIYATVVGPVQFRAKNDSGSTLFPGTAVYIKGISGETPTVDKANASSGSTMPAFGIVSAVSNDNSECFVTTFGDLKNINTSAFSVGQTVYISADSDGALTQTKPSNVTDLIQNIGLVTRVHPSAGSIRVGGSGRTNDIDNATRARLDSDSLAIQNHSGRIATLEARADSDELQLQNINTRIDNLSTGFDSDQVVAIISENPGSQAINTTVYTFTSPANDSEFTGTDDNGLTLAYTPGKVYVYLNGVLLVNTTDYIATDGISIILVEAPDSENVLQIVKHEGTVQSGFDSDQVVAIINENVVSGSVDSDVAAIAQLRRDADSDSLRIQAIATEIEQLNVLVDSDLKAIADLRNDVDSDSVAIQAIRTDMDVSFDIANNGASAYTFTGDGFPSGVDNPTLYLHRGHTYNFRVNASGHPFEIRLSNGGSAYSTGVTNNAAQVGLVKFVVPMDAPETLVYQCTIHSGMVGTIKVGKQGFDSDQIASMILENASPGMTDSDLAVVAKLRADVDSDSIKLQALEETVAGLSASSGFDSDQVVAIINENPTSSGTGMTDSDLKVVADLRNDITALQIGGIVSQESKFTTFKYKATQGQSTFSGLDRDNQTLAYTVGNINVYINGILLNDSDDYTATNGTSVVLDLAADSDDVVVIQKMRSAFDSDTILSIWNNNQSNLTISRYDYTATQSQTVFSGADDNGNSLSYIQDKIQVFLNGILLVSTDDYTATNGTSLTLTVAADSDDKLSIIKYLGADAQASDNLSVTRFTYKYTIDGNGVVGDSEITGGDENGNTLSYVVGKIQVYSNGILLEDSDDYVAIDGSTITLRAAPDSDDVVSIFKYLGTTQSGFDSDQIVAIINENLPVDQTGFDSDQVVAIINENSSSGGVLSIDADDNIFSSNTTSSITAGSGLQNVSIGNNAGDALTTGDYNVAIGTEALGGATNQGNNIAIGRNSMQSGNPSVAIALGFASASTSNSSSTISIGQNAHNGSTSPGNSSIAIGDTAGRYSVSTTGGVIAIGTGAGASNSGAGFDKGHSVLIGYRAGYGMGVNGGPALYNVAIGYQALDTSKQSTTNSGDDNIAIGRYAGASIASSIQNIAIGLNALNTGSSTGCGSDNIGIGNSSGQSITGHQNICIGLNSGYTGINSGSYNICIGIQTTTSTTASNSVTIGYNLTGKGSNTGFFGGTSANYNAANTSSWNTTSDERVKKNITDYTLGLDVLNQLNVKTYNYRSDSDIAETYPELADSDGLVHENLPQDKTVVGLIAQELETVLPNSVTIRDNGFKSMDKDELFWVMLNSIKELKTANDSLVARVEALENA